MCDQLAPQVLGCYGGPVRAPNLDRLAREGVIFTEATCPFPVCSPSRASFITGLHPHAHGIVHNVNRRDYPAISSPLAEEGVKTSDVTTESLLFAAGYETHHYGKWHLGDDDLPCYTDMFGEHGEYVRRMSGVFEKVRGRPSGEWMDWYGWAIPVEISGPLQEAVSRLGDEWSNKQYAEFIAKMGRTELAPEQIFDVQVADRTVERLRNLGEDPFMITCSFNYPHDPNIVPSPYYESFAPEQLRLPENFESLEGRFRGEWSRQIVSDLGEAAAREFLRIYYACVRLVDDQVGRILEALEAAGRAEDTIVVFTADHGDMAGGHGMVWKSTNAFYEEVVRVPLIMRYPRELAPGRSGLAAGLTDLMPTLLDLVGHPVPDRLQGHSLAPCLRGERDPAEAPAYAFCERVAANPQHTRTVAPGTPGSFMVRGRGWKYIRYHDGEEFLYDLGSDPGETTDLAGDPSLRDRKAGLRRELDAWLAETGYPGAG